MFSYAGVYLSDPISSDIGAWIESTIRPSELFPFAANSWPGTLSDGPIFQQDAEPWRPVRINTLFWPTGASRFAQAHFVVGDKQLNQIRSKVYAGNSFAAEDLVFSDSKNSVTASMWMLPARPLSTAAADCGMWLLTLVDERYYWWQSNLDLEINAGVTTWLNIYTSIGTALDITITTTAVDSAYGTPPAGYTSRYRAIPILFDAVAFSIGHRVVRTLDGDVKVQTASAAIDSAALEATNWADRKFAGGKFALTP